MKDWYFYNMLILLLIIVMVSTIQEDKRFYKFIEENNITEGEYFKNITFSENQLLNKTYQINFTTKGNLIIKYPRGEELKSFLLLFFVILFILLNIYYTFKYLNRGKWKEYSR